MMINNLPNKDFLAYIHEQFQNGEVLRPMQELRKFFEHYRPLFEYDETVDALHRDLEVMLARTKVCEEDHKKRQYPEDRMRTEKMEIRQVFGAWLQDFYQTTFNDIAYTDYSSRPAIDADFERFYARQAAKTQKKRQARILLAGILGLTLLLLLFWFTCTKSS